MFDDLAEDDHVEGGVGKGQRLGVTASELRAQCLVCDGMLFTRVCDVVTAVVDADVRCVAPRDPVGHQGRAAPHVEHVTAVGARGRSGGRKLVVAHLVAVLVVLAPHVELFFDRGHLLVVVPRVRLPVRGAQQLALVRSDGARGRAVSHVDVGPQRDQ